MSQSLLLEPFVQRERDAEDEIGSPHFESPLHSEHDELSRITFEGKR